MQVIHLHNMQDQVVSQVKAMVALGMAMGHLEGSKTQAVATLVTETAKGKFFALLTPQPRGACFTCGISIF